jgi:excisionase family DNA binding protein
MGQAGTGMVYTLSAAAKAVGLGKSTLHRAIKSGRLSATRLDDGSYRIDPAELARVFPPEPHGPSPWDTTARDETLGNPPVPSEALLSLKVTMLEAALERERDSLANERETTADLRRRLDRAEERVQALTYQAPSGPHEPSRARGLLARLLGR